MKLVNSIRQEQLKNRLKLVKEWFTRCKGTFSDCKNEDFIIKNGFFHYQETKSLIENCVDALAYFSDENNNDYNFLKNFEEQFFSNLVTWFENLKDCLLEDFNVINKKREKEVSELNSFNSGLSRNNEDEEENQQLTFKNENNVLEKEVSSLKEELVKEQQKSAVRYLETVEMHEDQINKLKEEQEERLKEKSDCFKRKEGAFCDFLKEILEKVSDLLEIQINTDKFGNLDEYFDFFLLNDIRKKSYLNGLIECFNSKLSEKEKESKGKIDSLKAELEKASDKEYENKEAILGLKEEKENEQRQNALLRMENRKLSGKLKEEKEKVNELNGTISTLNLELFKKRERIRSLVKENNEMYGDIYNTSNSEEMTTKKDLSSLESQQINLKKERENWCVSQSSYSNEEIEGFLKEVKELASTVQKKGLEKMRLVFAISEIRDFLINKDRGEKKLFESDKGYLNNCFDNNHEIVSDKKKNNNNKGEEDLLRIMREQEEICWKKEDYPFSHCECFLKTCPFNLKDKYIYQEEKIKMAIEDLKKKLNTLKQLKQNKVMEENSCVFHERINAYPSGLVFLGSGFIFFLLSCFLFLASFSPRQTKV